MRAHASVFRGTALPLPLPTPFPLPHTPTYFTLHPPIHPPPPAVFIVTVSVREVTPEGDEVIRVGKLYLVDLAGSENITR